jgi:hypothetical protein
MSLTHIYNWTGPIAAGEMTLNTDGSSLVFVSSHKLEVGQGISIDGTSVAVKLCVKSFGGYLVIAYPN